MATKQTTLLSFNGFSIVILAEKSTVGLLVYVRASVYAYELVSVCIQTRNAFAVSKLQFCVMLKWAYDKGDQITVVMCM